MNLFRKAEIHTVAMGEADNDLMRRLAEIGLGRYRSIGFLGRAGRVNAWWIVGPYPAPDVKAWERKEAPEDAVALSLPTPVEERPVYWRRVFTSHAAGFVNLDREFEPRDKVFAYAFARVFVEAETEARLVMGSDDGIRVWLNDAARAHEVRDAGLQAPRRQGRRDPREGLEPPAREVLRRGRPLGLLRAHHPPRRRAPRLPDGVTARRGGRSDPRQRAGTGTF